MGWQWWAEEHINMYKVAFEEYFICLQWMVTLLYGLILLHWLPGCFRVPIAQGSLLKHLLHCNDDWNWHTTNTVWVSMNCRSSQTLRVGNGTQKWGIIYFKLPLMWPHLCSHVDLEPSSVKKKKEKKKHFSWSLGKSQSDVSVFECVCSPTGHPLTVQLHHVQLREAVSSY